MRELTLFALALLLGLGGCTIVPPTPQPTATVVTPVPQGTYVTPLPYTTYVTPSPYTTTIPTD
jgi:hypothetical protein